jgi:hypothetical protein
VIGVAEPEHEVARIDELVDWELTTSPAAQIEAAERKRAEELLTPEQQDEVQTCLQSLDELAEYLDEAQLERRRSVAARRGAECRAQWRQVGWSVAVLLANMAMLLWNAAPLLWWRPPGPFTGISLIASVFCVRLVINSVADVLVCRRTSRDAAKACGDG